MLKIKIATEMNTIYVATPNRILDVRHTKMCANIDSVNDYVTVEFYDVVNEQAFDLTNNFGYNNLENFKLLS